MPQPTNFDTSRPENVSREDWALSRIDRLTTARENLWTALRKVKPAITDALGENDTPARKAASELLCSLSDECGRLDRLLDEISRAEQDFNTTQEKE